MLSPPEHELFFVLVLDNGLIRHVDVRPDQFSRKGGDIYRLIRDAIDSGTGVSVSQLVDWYERGRISRELAEDLGQGPEHQPAADAQIVKSCCAAIRERWAEQETRRAIAETSELPPAARTSELLQRLQKIQSGTQTAPVLKLSDLAVQAFQRLDADETAAPVVASTPWPLLNEKLDGGFRAGEYILVGARPSMGKSTFLRLIAQHVDGPVLFCTAEDTPDMVTLRAIASSGGVLMSHLRSGGLMDEEWMMVGDAVGALRDSQVEILSGDAMTVEQIAAAAATKPYKLVVVDYLQMIVKRGRDQTEDAGRISLELKRLARRCDAPVMVASQLNRELERRPNKRPINADLRQTGDLEQDADTILFLYRDEVYAPNSKDSGLIEVIVSKQRNGAAGHHCYVKLPADLPRGRIG